MTLGEHIWQLVHARVQEESGLCEDCRWAIHYGPLHRCQGGTGCAVPGNSACPGAQSVLRKMLEDVECNRKKPEVAEMKLTPKGLFVCRLVATAVEPSPYDVVVISGDSPPKWEDCAPYPMADDAGQLIPTTIRILVGEGYLQSLLEGFIE